jgi:hypothetical protein
MATLSTNVSEDLMFAEMSKLPDFDCFPIPKEWFKKFNLPPRDPIGPKEFIESRYTLLKGVEHKDLPPIIIDEPQQDGKLVEPVVEEPIKVEVINRPFVWKEGTPFPAILPAIAELETKTELSIPE